jgi:hypothetical protein
MENTMTNDMTNPDNTGVMSPDDIALMRELGQQHKSEFKLADKAIPWLTIVQSGSPVAVNDDPQYIPGAREGLIIDNVTMRLRERVAFIPVVHEVNYTEWKPVRGPGALVKQWFTDSSAYDAAEGSFGKRKMANGNDIVPSSVFYGIAYDEDGSNLEVVLAFTGTQAKKARRLATLIDMLELPDGNGGTFKPPIYSRLYGLSTIREKNDQGKWMGWRIEPGPMVLKIGGGRSLIDKARDFRERYDRGEVRAIITPTVASEQAESRAAARDEDQLPF